MNKLLFGVPAIMMAACVCGAATDPADAHPGLHLIPWPKSLPAGAGCMPLTADSRIVAGEEQLRPLADMMSGEIAFLTCGSRKPRRPTGSTPKGL